MVDSISTTTERHGDSSWLALWIYFSAWATASGWILSMVNLLNRTGYILSLLLGALLLWRRFPIRSLQRVRFGKIMKRWKHPLPAIFFVMTILVFAGGAIHLPNNYDFLTYRFPRILHWTAENTWHWIHTRNPRMNYSATGFEWLMTPLLVFFKTDRFFFLINFISFCFLPGLIFSTFRGLGIKGRHAWIAMWLLPSGYCYVLQAGSAANDAFSTVYLLAAIHFALKARAQRTLSFLFLSWLPVSLFTGAKLSNLPLLLPWMILVAPILNQLVKNYGKAFLGFVFGLLVSILPVIVLNAYNSGDWTGDPSNTAEIRVRNPAAAIVGNALQLTSGNLMPPLFPWAGEWNKEMPEIPVIKNHYPRFSLEAGEMQIEETAGIGLGVSMFLLLVAFLSKHRKRKVSFSNNTKLFIVTVLLSILVFMATMATESAPRVFSPYYVLVAAMILLCANQINLNTSTFRLFAAIVALSAFPLLILSPSRPLWPAVSITKTLHEQYPKNARLARAFEVYSVYGNRARSLSALYPYLPKSAGPIGLIRSGDDPESPLWVPFGIRKVVELFPEENPCSQGISTIVVHKEAVDSGLQYWLQNNHGQVVAQSTMTTKVKTGLEDWDIVTVDCSVQNNGNKLSEKKL